MYDVIPVTSPRETDCGATCLKMLLDYYGIDVPLDQITKELETRLIGCSAADIMRVARAHGLDDVQSYSIDADELVRQDRPAIIHWKYNHWCVFCGCDDEGRVSIANPDRGRFRMSFGTFAALFTGLESHPDQGVAIFNGEPHDLLPVATANVPAGEVFEVAGTYYKALVAIVRGEQVVEGINALQVSLAEIVNLINNANSEEQ